MLLFLLYPTGMRFSHFTVQHADLQKREKSVTVPDLIDYYNRYMGDTDLVDCNISNYCITIRMKKWWWSVLSFMVSSSVVNPSCIYWLAKSEKLDLPNFTHQIAITYLLKCSKRCEMGWPVSLPQHVMQQVVPNEVHQSAGHYPVSMKQNHCKICQRNMKRSCGKCGVNVRQLLYGFL